MARKYKGREERSLTFFEKTAMLSAGFSADSNTKHYIRKNAKLSAGLSETHQREIVEAEYAYYVAEELSETHKEVL